MACLKTKNFFESGSSNQFEWVLALYDQVLRLKAEAKSQKPENVIKLDKWWVLFLNIYHKDASPRALPSNKKACASAPISGPFLASS